MEKKTHASRSSRTKVPEAQEEKKREKKQPTKGFFFFTRRFKNNIFKIIFSQVLEIEIVVTTKKRFMFSMMMWKI